MSIIAVKGVPLRCSLQEVVKMIARLVAGPFEPLNFTTGKNQAKICYLRLSEKLDPVRVVERINSSPASPKGYNLTAYVPEHVPDLPLASRKTKIPLKIHKDLNIPKMQLPHEVILITHQDLYLELQYKYPRLYNLSRKTGHKLLDELSRTIGDRLKQVMDAHPETRDSPFNLSMTYRKMHPHFGDFQLLLSTLHRLQDAAGAPRMQLQEPELTAPYSQPYAINNIPLDKVKQASSKYNTKITSVITRHLESLDTSAPCSTEEDIARNKIREELKKMTDYLPTALKQVINAHFMPEEQPHRTVRVYGEPFLPGRDLMAPITSHYVASGTRVARSQTMYNLLTFKVPQANYARLCAMDATVISGSKLVIRSSEIPLREVSRELRAALAAALHDH